MKYLITAAFLALYAWASAQTAQLKPVEMADIHRWKSIDKQTISADGQWVAYTVSPVSEGDSELRLWNAATNQSVRFERAVQPAFSEDNNWLVFTVKPALDSIRALKRKKIKADDLPKDTLYAYSLVNGTTLRYPRVKSHFLPEYWSGWLVVHLEPAAKTKEKEKSVPTKDSINVSADTTQKKPEKPAKTKKESAENGSLLLITHLKTGITDTIPFVTTYAAAKAQGSIIFHTTGTSDAAETWKKNTNWAIQGVYFNNLEKNKKKALYRGKAKYKHLTLAENGDQAAFLLDTDTTKAVIRPWMLAYATTNDSDTAKIIADNYSQWMPSQPRSAAIQGKWLMSENGAPVFSKSGDKLFFGIAPPRFQPDTTLLPEEVAKVEVWATSAPLLYTNMKERLKNDLKKTWPVVCFTGEKPHFSVLADPLKQEMRYIFDRHRSSDWALAIDEEPYSQAAQWLGEAGKDVYAVHLKSGSTTRITQGNIGNVYLSPLGNFALWWSAVDTAWWMQSLKNKTNFKLTSPQLSDFHNTEDDTPDFPNQYGFAGWLDGENAVLLYDRYDIWRMPILTRESPRPITNGRKEKNTFRYINTDNDQLTINPNEPILLHAFNDDSKKESYWTGAINGTGFKPWMQGNYTYTKLPLKAKKSTTLVYSRQNFDEFPDLRLTRLPGNGPVTSTLLPDARISNVNPQQAEYAWPTVQKVSWISLTGDTLSGLVFRPANYDAEKKHPMIVNFYEKLSDGLYQHRAPSFGRSQISPVQYASRGYVVFMPDIPYRIGYPGESAYNAVVSGTTWMIQQGGIDPERVALQGHSWGGYQAAYIITKTNLFRCAEAGAAVVNMTSAYGGVRWETGVSRHFQYEKQQSRIGGTLWDKPLLFLENSPLFSLNKVQTPVLILHNDKDGAVPWEQGIEFFTGLRRLGKPAWLLNYNDEPHWPVKLPNRIDFQTRMQDFFDYYLQGTPQPRWMEKGIPPIER